MKFPRAALVANIMIVGATLPATLYPVTTTNSSAALPLYQFVDTGSGPLPWNAVSFESSINDTTMLGNPHAASEDGEDVLTYRMANSQIGLFVENAIGTTSWTDLSTLVDTPTPASDPVAFFDPSGNVGVVYVSTQNHVILISSTVVVAPRGAHVAGTSTRPAYVLSDLSAKSGLSVAAGLPSVGIDGASGFVAVRSSANLAEVFPLSWTDDHNPPTQGAPVNVSAGTSTGTISSDPVALAGTTTSFAALSTSGNVELFTSSSSNFNAWSAKNLTASTGASAARGSLSTSASAQSNYVVALSASGNVQLFTSPLVVGATNSSWSLDNVTSTTVGAPPLDGSVFVQATSTQLFIAGQAANWGDLFVLTSSLGSSAWTATDVSVTGGSAARSVGPGVTGLIQGANLVLYAAGVSSPPPQGVGVYAIPTSDWSSAIASGWPIISDTGGLGTQSTPWVGFTSAKSVATSPDFLLGQSIYNSHKRVTWLSFWTVSGPLKSQPQTTASYYGNGFAAGAWVATQIDQYRGLGVGLKPDWVVFDPEGYPDNHSGLDAPSGSSNAVLATYATYWSAMLSGWSSGLASVDPSLKPAVYATQSEYRNYNLTNQSLSVFEAVAFANGGPLPVAGATGSNVRGYIAYDASCTPTSTLQSEVNTLTNPPWSGQFNTLQFNAGVYCAPVSP
ncbi:MAG TPA: hypothetical protein VGE75_02065 [Acidimicrobiales bacterium]